MPQKKEKAPCEEKSGQEKESWWVCTVDTKCKDGNDAQKDGYGTTKKKAYDQAKAKGADFCKIHGGVQSQVKKGCSNVGG